MIDAAELDAAPEATEPVEELAVLVPEAPEPPAFAKGQEIAVDGQRGIFTFDFYRRTRGKGILQARVIDREGKPHFYAADKIHLPTGASGRVRAGSRNAEYLEALQRDGTLVITVPSVGPTGGKTPHATASAQVYTLARKAGLSVKIHREGNTLTATVIDPA